MGASWGRRSRLGPAAAPLAGARRQRVGSVPTAGKRAFEIPIPTNGVTEGINNKIKLLKRIAYGLPNFAHLQARILIEFTSELSSPP